ncbi:ATP-binding protein [Litoribacter ruber]|uniref:ATP-binding protein n=1 Tax=Litoribacter ruber TaxID=702568 RepID=UPI001BD940E3|nr:AAA family ATPase [Litoribacter ruber]MBT0811114.1 ATP-binding protein [Litoribacter ruber]
MNPLYNKYRSLLNTIKLNFKRSLIGEINWQSRGICITGARGTGKSTLMLQYIKENLSPSEALYLSLDDLYFKQHSLVEVAESFIQQGGKYLFLDEVHKYDDWQLAVKNIYDFNPELKLILSGSSILALQKSVADLSRRLVYYELPELSLREYIAIKSNLGLPRYSIADILTHHMEISNELSSKVPLPLAELAKHLQFGAYPFFLEGEQDFFAKITQLINLIIDYDLPFGKDITVATQSKLKKLLYILSTSVPFTPNISKLAEKTETTRLQLLEFLHLLEASRLVRNLRSSTVGVSMMNKPDKIYLHNTSLIHALAEGTPEKGNIRETFTMAQLQNAGLKITFPKNGDFLVNGKYLFEVGGKQKNQKQIHAEKDIYIIADDLVHGYGNKVPMYLLGFLY